jgi:hypothetical protein
MEFDVIDPKDHSFQTWIGYIEGFLSNYSNYTKEEGIIYFTQNDIAEPWNEDSIVYQVEGDEGGLIEIRDGDSQIYLFAEGFAGRNLKDSKEGNQFQLQGPGTVYGFEHNSLNRSRFHLGPIGEIYFLHQGEGTHCPQPTPSDRLWQGTLIQAIQWIHNQVNRFQEQKRISSEFSTVNIFELDVSFTHPSAVNLVLERVRSRTYVKKRERQRIVIQLENPTFETLRDLFEAMPSGDEYYNDLKLLMSWGVENEEGERTLITYIGAEKRKLKPFIHIPRQKSAKSFREAFRAHFKGFRVDRQEYLLD